MHTVTAPFGAAPQAGGGRRGAAVARRAGPLALALLLACGTAGAQWLGELQRSALALDPAVAGAEAQLRGAEERTLQAGAGFGPTATASYSSNETRYREAPANDLRPFRGTQTVLQLTQPLLRGSLWPALEGARALTEQARLNLGQARTDATLRLLEALFDLLKARDAAALVDAQRLAAAEQLASARRSYQVGRSTIVDVRDAEAKVDTVAAQALAAAADLSLKQALLAELVGRPVPELMARGLGGETLPTLGPDALAPWLADAAAGSAQLQAALQALEAAEAEVRKAWQGHAPTVDLTYSYTDSNDTGTVTSVVPRRGTAGQVGIAINVPLFASGATQSKVREAMAARDKARSEVDAARRALQLAVRQSFAAALSAAGLARGLETATRSLEVALRANQRGQEVGVKVIADVLDAQTKLFESRRDLSKARYDAWLQFTRLQGLAGRLDDAALQALELVLGEQPPALPETRRRSAEVRP